MLKTAHLHLNFKAIAAMKYILAKGKKPGLFRTLSTPNNLLKFLFPAQQVVLYWY